MSSVFTGIFVLWLTSWSECKERKNGRSEDGTVASTLNIVRVRHRTRMCVLKWMCVCHSSWAVSSSFGFLFRSFHFAHIYTKHIFFFRVRVLMLYVPYRSSVLLVQKEVMTREKYAKKNKQFASEAKKDEKTKVYMFQTTKKSREQRKLSWGKREENVKQVEWEREKKGEKEKNAENSE